MQAFRTAFRRLRRRPGQALTAAVVFGAGIGLSAAALSPLWRATIAPLPILRPNRVVAIWEISAARGWTDTPASPANLRDWSQRVTSLAEVAFHASARDRLEDGSELLLETPGGAELTRVLNVSTNLFHVLGRVPAEGRDFVTDDGAPGGAPVIVLSHELATRTFGGARSAVGQRLRVEGVEHLIVGVMPRGFWFPHASVRAWTPMRVPSSDFQTRRQARVFRVVARLADAATIPAARAELHRAAADLAREYPRTNGDTSADLSLLSDWLTGPRRGPYQLAALCGGLLLAIALVNAAVLSWTSLQAREQELAVARALGASRARVILETVAESVLLAVMSVVIAWPIGLVAIGLSRTAFGASSADAGLDWRALLVTSLTSATGLALAVAMIARRQPATSAPMLHRHSRAVITAPSRWPIAVQIGLAVVVVAACAAALHSYSAVASVPSGLRPVAGSQVAVTVTLRGPKYRDQRAVARYFQTVLEQVRALPRVSAAGAAAVLPLNGAGYTSTIWMPDVPGLNNVEVRQREITDGYAAATGLRVVEGREFSAVDDASRPAVLVNAAFVARYCGGRSPIGLALFDAPPERARTPSLVAGVVADERLDPRGAPATPIVYRLHQAVPEETMTIVALGDAAPAAMLPGITRLVRDADPSAVVLRAERLDRAIGRAVSREEAIATLAAIAAGVALLLAVAGVFGTSLLDARRLRRDLAIRAALGADARRVAAIVWSRWAPAIAGGLAIGFVLAWASRGAMRRAMPAIEPAAADAVWAIACVSLTAAIALWPAARHASRTDPLTLLRE